MSFSPEDNRRSSWGNHLPTAGRESRWAGVKLCKVNALSESASGIRRAARQFPSSLPNRLSDYSSALVNNLT